MGENIGICRFLSRKIFIIFLSTLIIYDKQTSASITPVEKVHCLLKGGTRSHCLVLGCKESGPNECTLPAGEVVISVLNEPTRPDEESLPNRLLLVAGLNSRFAASGHFGDRDIIFTVGQNRLTASVTRPRNDVVLDRVRFFGFPKSASIPRVLRLNGQLLRRGDLHYHRDTQSLELFDLKLPLDVSWELDLLSVDAEADQVECPVSYINRNPDYSIPQASCFSPCVWDGTNCWLPGPLTYGYTVNGPVETTTFGWRILLRKFGPSLYNAALEYISVEIFVYSETLVRIKIYDPSQPRYEVPIALNLPTQPFTGQTDYDVVYPTIQGSVFYIQVVRRDTGTVIFDTSMAGITFENQLLSIALRLATRNLYGIGENYHATFRREFDDSTWPLWSRDELPNPYLQHNLYGVHPFYEVVENDGKAHGVLLYNSNAMDYQLQSAAPAVVWRTIGGILDFYVVTGPEPEDVVKQYTNMVGRSFLPPYWSFGFQLSRWGYNNLTNMQAAVERTISCEIPLDVFYGDIDTMDNEADFTIDPINFAGLPAYVDEKRAQGMRYVPIVDPAIPTRPGYEPYDRGLVSNSYIRLENGDVLLGNVWPPEPVSFPDFFRSNTSSWWTEEIRIFYETLKFDGLWIDMNEPANFETNIPDPEGGYRLFCPTTTLDDPPYVPKAGMVGTVKRLSDKTICMNTRQGDNNIYSHYDVHSLYGYSETIPTSTALQAVTGKRGLVFTRSSFVGSGILGGHWTGDNYAYWDHMQYSVIGMLDFNLFGLPYVGADICGFIEHTEERLCQRWQELGAFYPFSRNHNSIGAIDQDPCIWPNTVGNSTRKAMNIRYRMLPYFYTMFYRANQGMEGTVIRSLLHQFPEDRTTLAIDRQFLWGDAFLVSPALDIDALSTPAYLPAGRWYDYYTGSPLDSIGQFIILDVPYDFIPLHVRGGRILPVQTPANTTTYSRLNSFGLVVATNATGFASGDLFWDDGESIGTVASGQYHYSTFLFVNNILTQTIEHPSPNNLLQGMFVEDVEVFGMSAQPTGVTGDVGANVSIAYDAINQKASLLNAHIPADINYVVTFTFN